MQIQVCRKSLVKECAGPFCDVLQYVMHWIPFNILMDNAPISLTFNSAALVQSWCVLHDSVSVGLCVYSLRPVVDQDFKN